MIYHFISLPNIQSCLIGVACLPSLIWQILFVQTEPNIGSVSIKSFKFPSLLSFWRSHADVTSSPSLLQSFLDTPSPGYLFSAQPMWQPFLTTCQSFYPFACQVAPLSPSLLALQDHPKSSQWFTDSLLRQTAETGAQSLQCSERLVGDLHLSTTKFWEQVSCILDLKLWWCNNMRSKQPRHSSSIVWLGISTYDILAKEIVSQSCSSWLKVSWPAWGPCTLKKPLSQSNIWPMWTTTGSSGLPSILSSCHFFILTSKLFCLYSRPFHSTCFFVKGQFTVDDNSPGSGCLVPPPLYFPCANLSRSQTVAASILPIYSHFKRNDLCQMLSALLLPSVSHNIYPSRDLPLLSLSISH